MRRCHIHCAMKQSDSVYCKFDRNIPLWPFVMFRLSISKWSWNAKFWKDRAVIFHGSTRYRKFAWANRNVGVPWHSTLFGPRVKQTFPQGVWSLKFRETETTTRPLNYSNCVLEKTNLNNDQTLNDSSLNPRPTAYHSTIAFLLFTLRIFDITAPTSFYFDVIPLKYRMLYCRTIKCLIVSLKNIIQ